MKTKMLALFIGLIGIFITGSAIGSLNGAAYGFLTIGGMLSVLSIILSFFIKKG